MRTMSKSQFKPNALAIMRDVERSGEALIITDHGKPTLQLRPYNPEKPSPFERLKGSVIKYTDPTLPVGDEDWELA